MSKKNKLLEKLIEAAGGWEKFLYQTLKEVCNEIDPTDVGEDMQNLYDEAMEILAAYEEIIVRGQPTHIPGGQVQPVVEDVSKVVEASKPPTLEKSKPAQSAKIESHKPKPIRQLRNLTARVSVDSEVGASHGELPVPADCVLTHREYMTVETQGGLELGRGSSDGQVRGPGVSGYITLTGVYRLAFTDTALGVGLVHFTILQKEKKEEPKVLSHPELVKSSSPPELVKPSSPSHEDIGGEEIREE